MEEFGGEEYVVALEKSSIAIVVVDVVLGVHVIEQGPGVDQGTLLRVQLVEQVIEVEVEAAFIAVIPNHDAGMIDVFFDHLVYQLRADLGVIGMVPAGELVEDKNAQRITDIEEMVVGRVVRHPHGVHVHFFEELDVFYADGFVEGTAGSRPEAMTTNAFELDTYPVDIDAVAFPELNGAETEALFDGMDRCGAVLQRIHDLIEMRSLGVPGLRVFEIGLALCERIAIVEFGGKGVAIFCSIEGIDLCGDLIRASDAAEMDQGVKIAIGFGIDSLAGDMLNR